MIPLHQTSTLFSFGRKIFSLENMLFLLLATPGSVSLAHLLESLVGDTPLKDLVLPLLVAAISLSMYFVVFLLDFFSGVKASRHEAQNKSDYFTSAKAWSSLWKLAIVAILVLWSSFFSMLAALSGVVFLPKFFLLASGTIAIMATLLDIYSIGENQKRLTGKKSRFFEWLEQLRETINQELLGRLKRMGKPP